ncbi:MAG: malto-oligosyltrehalose synthase, partial [Flavobacterium sp.]
MPLFKPTATYRVQLHKNFNFSALRKIIPYLKSLGIDTIYASPIFKAIAGSEHGYDGVSPLAINPEIGTEEELLEISTLLKQNDMYWLQDIVPNHMAFSTENEWLMDVLEKGAGSAYFHYFDTQFPNNLEDKRLMVPFLGEDLSEALEAGKIRIEFKDNNLFLAYGETYWPINASSYDLILDQSKGKTVFKKLINETKHKTQLKNKLRKLNADKGFLKTITDQQYYRLCNWQETTAQLNYRRFFTVNSLICLNVQHQDVFDHYHKYIVELVGKDVFQGLRIDHIDGLADPKTYLQMLRKTVGDSVYITVEKILEVNERLPADWETQGTTGYDFLQLANNVLTNASSEKVLDKIYQNKIDENIDLNTLTLDKKKAIIFTQMGGELANLRCLLMDLNYLGEVSFRKFEPSEIETAIAELLIHFQVYRFYENEFPLNGSTKNELETIFSNAQKHTVKKDVLKLLKRSLLTKTKDGKLIKDRGIFFNRCMQFSGPLMAKGVEDTVMYAYNRFLAHNEVGDAPGKFGLSIKDFHERIKVRANGFKNTMNATATHDTKRGEDMRTRLQAISTDPQRWLCIVKCLDEIRPKHKVHPNDIYFIYQTIVGSYPVLENDLVDFSARLEVYLEKVLREAKKRSDWAEPAEDYENEVKNFVRDLINETKNSTEFNTQLDFFVKAGFFNSLLQSVLKYTVPGIPDTYQGSELWDFSLVDPDNRRPVDYQLRKKYLQNIKQNDTLSKLWEHSIDGKIKLSLIQKLLAIRHQNKLVFNEGDYIPISVKGKYKNEVLAYVRSYQNQKLLFVLPVGLTSIATDVNTLKIDWRNTRLQLDDACLGEWKDLLNLSSPLVGLTDKNVHLSELLADFPIGVFQLQIHKGKRSSGVFLPISSLASSHHIGTLGTEAHQFVDFLRQSKQRYWQMLPLNPVNEANFYSPYSSSSSMAGNVLLISPTLLAANGWLELNDIVVADSKTDGIDYEMALQQQMQYLKLAFQNYKSAPDKFEVDFEQFCKEESYWLDDFAMFTFLDDLHQHTQWSNWPEAHKKRERKTITELISNNALQLEEIKWQQFVFDLQFNNLRDYALTNQVQFVGDLPIYVSYHSADVWANPGLFKLDAEYNTEVVAGVPPDAFSDDGQLWGMPIFNWGKMKETGYDWWMKRIAKNLKHFDLIRLDHFRAFHTYWEIPADA